MVAFAAGLCRVSLIRKVLSFVCVDPYFDISSTGRLHVSESVLVDVSNTCIVTSTQLYLPGTATSRLVFPVEWDSP